MKMQKLYVTLLFVSGLLTGCGNTASERVLMESEEKVTYRLQSTELNGDILSQGPVVDVSLIGKIDQSTDSLLLAKGETLELTANKELFEIAVEASASQEFHSVHPIAFVDYGEAQGPLEYLLYPQDGTVHIFFEEDVTILSLTIRFSDRDGMAYNAYIFFD